MEAKLQRLRVSNKNLRQRLKIANSEEMSNNKRSKVSKQTVLDYLKTQDKNTKQILLFDYRAWLSK